MIEHIKSFILLALVLLSLFFTHSLWYGQEPVETVAADIYEQVVTEDPRPLDEVINPVQITLNTGEDSYAYREGDRDYALFWEQLQQELARTDFHRDQQEVLLTEEVSYRMQYLFELPLPAGGDLPLLPGFSTKKIDRIELISTLDESWLLLGEHGSEAETAVRLSAGSVESFTRLVENSSSLPRNKYILLTADLARQASGRDLEVAEGIFLPTSMEHINNLALKPEQLNREMLLRTFFVDYNLARVIEERDGALIYTDGERGLRLNRAGLEYSHPRLERGHYTASYPEALNSVSSLISYHGGWPTGLRLSKMELIGRGGISYYMADWKMYYQGYPIFSKAQVRLLLNDLGLIYYTRELLVPAAANEKDPYVKLEPWDRALAALLDLLEEQRPGYRAGWRLEAMCLGYAALETPEGIVGKPAWHIMVNNNAYYLLADSLALINEGELY